MHLCLTLRFLRAVLTTTEVVFLVRYGSRSQLVYSSCPSVNELFAGIFSWAPASGWWFTEKDELWTTSDYRFLGFTRFYIIGVIELLLKFLPAIKILVLVQPMPKRNFKIYFSLLDSYWNLLKISSLWRSLQVLNI
jgi:hypothetical protein